MSVLKIYYTVEHLYKTKFNNANTQFKRGFSKCLALFEIGIAKRTDFNLLLRNKELEDEVKELKKILGKKYKRLRDMEKDMAGISLIAGIPMQLFRTVLVETAIGNFSIVVNMDENTLQACILNFAIKKNFTTINEAKSKLLDFINMKKDLGFRAYKDEDVAIKEGARML